MKKTLFLLPAALLCLAALVACNKEKGPDMPSFVV